MTTQAERISALNATNAFYNVSFDPEGRLNRFIKDFLQTESEICELCNKYSVESEKFIEKHFRLALNYLHSQSRCLSWAITGPANFPSRRNEKRVNWAEGHLNNYCYFVENVEKTLKRITRRQETEDDKKTKWIKKVEELKQLQETMKKANALIRKGDKQGLIALVGEKQAEEILTPNFLGHTGFAAYELSNNLANIKRLEEQIRTIDKTRENKAESGFKFEGGEVVFDAEEIRFNIFFVSIPDAETRAALKSNGFKWSPKRQAWTRGAKTISINRIKEILNVKE